MDIKKVIHAINKDKISKNIQDEMLRELKKATVYYNKWCSKVQDHEQLLLRLNIVFGEQIKSWNFNIHFIDLIDL